MDTPIVPERRGMTAEEYGEAIRNLYRSGEFAKSSDQLAEQEFLLSINYRLGNDFPEDRRLLLLDAYRAMRDELKKLMRRFLSATFMPRRHARKIHELNQRLLDVFASILSPSEFEAFTGLESPDFCHQFVDPGKIPAH